MRCKLDRDFTIKPRVMSAMNLARSVGADLRDEAVMSEGLYDLRHTFATPQAEVGPDLVTQHFFWDILQL